jgi:hypothetical protein
VSVVLLIVGRYTVLTGTNQLDSLWQTVFLSTRNFLMKPQNGYLWSGVLLSFFFCCQSALSSPTTEHPLETLPTTKEVKVFGVIYPKRFNAAVGEEAHYHLLVWKGGTSTNALIETPADDLAFHGALRSLGAQPGNNLSIASWNKRYDPNHAAPHEKVIGDVLDVRLSWTGNPLGISLNQAFHQPETNNQKLETNLLLRFGGNRDRWFNKLPLAPRPGCLVCLYSCPSGKVSNSALSVHDYMEAPSRFMAKTDILPPDGTPVVVTFHVAQ